MLISPIKTHKLWTDFIIFEEPGEVTGYYQNGETKIPLSGKCKIEPQRQISKLGHNSIQIDFIKPPKGIGIGINFDSHYLNKKIETKLKFTPKTRVKFRFNKINP